MAFFPTDVAAQLLAKRGKIEYEPGDDSKIEGQKIDRIGAQSGLALVMGVVNVTDASGESIKLEIEIEDSPTDTDGDFEEYEKKEIEIPMDDTGTAEIFHALPVNLKGAKKYVRVNAKVDSDGNTINAEDDFALATALVLGGFDDKPNEDFYRDGYSDHDLEDVTS